MNGADKKLNRYQAVIADIFNRRYRKGSATIEFSREECIATAETLKLKPIKNVGDLVYTFRYRADLPENIRTSARAGFEWVIRGKGIARYELRQVKISRLVPRAELLSIKIPDATPEIISAYAQSDEQALLAKLRYNRLIDLFLGVTAYSLQSHWRTTVQEVGQIEIDEVYVGLDKHGRQYVIPVQAKGGNDKHGIVQTQQDIECCAQKYPTLLARPISAQFMADNRIAMFELVASGEEIKVVDEKHYQLVPADEITSEDLRAYNLKTR
jgi:hypothetical protein